MNGVFTMKRAIQLGILILAFLTMLVLSFEPEALFFFLVSLSSSEAANFAPAMLSGFLLVRSVPQKSLDLWSLD